MVAGGILIRTTRQNDISNAIRDIKHAAGVESEIKWTKFKGGGKKAAYTAIIDLFFNLLRHNQIHFHCIIAKFSEFSHKAFPGGDEETSVNRMYFQLITHEICKRYAPKCYIFIYPDSGDDSKDLRRYQGTINLTAQQKYGVEQRVALIEPVDSAKSNIIQMVDIMIGAIASSCNGNSSSNPEKFGKSDLAQYILRSAGRKTWLRTTNPKDKRLSIWVFKHQKIAAGGMSLQGTRRYIHQG